MSDYPFVYIAGIMRTGTTLLQEMLTAMPVSYIFHEPWFGSGLFEGQKRALQTMQDYNIPFADIVQRQPSIAEMFHRLMCHVKQLGVKEIRHHGWQIYPNIFEDVRFIILGRNPKDIYISAYYFQQRTDAWTIQFPPYSPSGLFKELLPDIARQMDIYDNNSCLKLKYEELCNGECDVDAILKDVGSPLAEMGAVGDFHSQIDRGVYELQTHGQNITDKNVNRWEREENKELLKEAEQFDALMGDYKTFWGY